MNLYEYQEAIYCFRLPDRCHLPITFTNVVSKQLLATHIHQNCMCDPVHADSIQSQNPNKKVWKLDLQAPNLFNLLPLEIHQAPSIRCFKSHLKTHFFYHAFD